MTRVVDEQPNRYNGNYPESYTGDKNGGGNRIYISTTSGEWWYMHLQAGNPIAVNPRTGVQFKANDEVYEGEIIGYMGILGNSSPSAPHLHLQFNEPKPADPMPNIYSKFNENGISINPCK